MNLPKIAQLLSEAVLKGGAESLHGDRSAAKKFRKISKYLLTNVKKCAILYLENLQNRKFSK